MTDNHVSKEGRVQMKVDESLKNANIVIRILDSGDSSRYHEIIILQKWEGIWYIIEDYLTPEFSYYNKSVLQGITEENITEWLTKFVSENEEYILDGRTCPANGLYHAGAAYEQQTKLDGNWTRISEEYNGYTIEFYLDLYKLESSFMIKETAYNYNAGKEDVLCEIEVPASLKTASEIVEFIIQNQISFRYCKVDGIKEDIRLWTFIEQNL